MLRSTLSAVSATIFLSACVTAPSAPPAVVPLKVQLPDLEPTPPDVLELSFTERMANFLQGRLPAQTFSGSGLRPVNAGIDKPKTP